MNSQVVGLRPGREKRKNEDSALHQQESEGRGEGGGGPLRCTTLPATPEKTTENKKKNETKPT